jgi:hypothetical protein
MKMIKIYMKLACLTLITGAVLFLSGCKKWVDVNYNPQQLTGSSATPDLIIADAMLNQANSISGDGVLSSWMGHFVYPFTLVADVSVGYNLTNTNYGEGAEAPAARGFKFMDQKAIELGQTFYSGIAKIMIAKIFAEDVDKLNNIPYRQSGNAELYPFPKFEDGKFIYEDVMRVIDTAMTLIKAAEISKNTRINTADIMFHGDKGKWLRFANTLKLRLLVHQANRADRATYINDQMAKINAEGSGFLHAGEDAALNPGFSADRPNPEFSMAGFYQGGQPSFYREGYGANLIAMNYLKQNNDPRLGFFFTIPVLPLPPGAPEAVPQIAPQNYRGNLFGLEFSSFAFPYQGGGYISYIGGATGYTPVTSTSSGVLKGYDMDSWMITSIESMFLQAEAVYRGWIPGDKKQAYLDAVRESFRWLNVGHDSTNPSASDAVFANWYASESGNGNASVSWDHAPDKYKLIMFQKYIALIGINARETWADYRRNGAYPIIPLSVHSSRTRNSIPVRFPYSAYEYKVNAENLNAQGPIDIFTSKIWWMP